MKIFVTGGAGQLGSELLGLETNHQITGPKIDITNKELVLSFMQSERPEAVINCAAWTAVDDCESSPEKAFLVNGDSVGWLADACHGVGAHLVHVSTDYVFDGEKEGPYLETDRTNPMSVYGKSKLRGELNALRYPFAVARTSWVCGRYGKNMVKTIMRLASEKDSLSFVADQVGNPTMTSDLAPALLKLATDKKSGVFHVTNQGAVSWFDFAREVVKLMGKDPDMIQPIKTHELSPPRPAPRPSNSVLSDGAWRTAGYDKMRDFRLPLAGLVKILG